MSTKRGYFPRTVSLPVALILGALLLAAVGVGVSAWLMFKNSADTDSARATALATARSYAVTLTTYDHSKIDESIADVLDGATGEFKQQYGDARGTLKQMVAESQASAEGTVVSSGVKSASTDAAQVLVFVDQTVTNGKEKPRTDRNALVLSLERHDDRWLVSKVQLL